jgi:hypothetical protein
MIMSEANNKVLVHPDIIGDIDSLSGTSDLDSRIHRWENPVAKIVITVNKEEY